MVASAASLMGSRGVDATSFRDVLEHSHAPRGSIYHYFPAGKQQLVDDAVRWTTEVVLAHQRSYADRAPSGVLLHFLSFFRESVVASRCRAGCPVAAAVVNAYTREELLSEVVRGGFRSWISLLTDQLTARGVPPRRARSLSITALASIEGALILCRAEGTVRPLDAVREELRVLAGPLGKSVRRSESPRAT